MNHLNPKHRLTYVLNNLKTTPEVQLLNMLPQNCDKPLLKLVETKEKHGESLKG